MSIGTKIKSFIIQSKRVWLILRKPTRKEFTTVAKVSALGILVLGLIGFVISLVLSLFTGTTG